MAIESRTPIETSSSTPAQATGPAPPARSTKWTVMIFMGADTIEGNEPLDQAVLDDLEEIAFVGASETLEVFVQVNRTKGGAQRHRFYLDEKGQPAVQVTDAPKVDDERVLIQFIDDCIGLANHSRDDHSMLVLWGHAYDFAFGRYRTRTGVVDAIDFIELSGMLQRLQDIVKERYAHLYADRDERRPTLDIIAFDACDVATVEMACQLQPFAKYLLGSEIGIPIPGWPYDRILRRLAQPIGRLMAPPEFGSWAVRRFVESYPSDMPVSLSFLDLAQAEDLRIRAELLALALAAAMADSDVRGRISELFIRSQTGADRPYVDVADLCLNLVRESGDTLVVEAARALGDLLLTPRFPLVGESQSGSGRPVIVDHGRNAGGLARLNGISIYAPHVAPGDVDEIRNTYDRFVFAKETVWSGLVHTLAADFQAVL